MSKRHRDAVAISDGACNPGAVAWSIVIACNDMRDKGARIDQICADPAIRLMVYQLGHITRAGKMSTDDYRKALGECQEESND